MVRVLLTIIMLVPGLCLAQTKGYKTQTASLSDLDFFTEPPKNWKIAGSVSGNYSETAFHTGKGTGILFNDVGKDIRGKNIFTKIEHSDIFLSLDFLVPKESNSGIYFEGRYEVQLLDSWMVTAPKSLDCGGIYERWDDAQPEGSKGYEGHPPLTNATFAPNTWQHLEVEFRAPRFDSKGKKISPARFVKVALNGVVIHENVVVFGPTRAAAYTDEKASGPLMIQGDHGPVAFRNIQYALLNEFSPTLSDLTYTYYEGTFNNFTELTKDKETRSGTAEAIDAKLADNPSGLGLVFKGKLHVDADDEYQFTLQKNGMAALAIDGQDILSEGNFSTKRLSAGDHAIQLSYIKNYPWSQRKLGLSIGKLNSRPLPLHTPSSVPSESPAPLITVVTRDEPEILRSFMVHGGRKKMHIISVGNPGGINYAYDLDQGALLSVWRGAFLNVTEMWHERGEPQVSSPLGAAIILTGTPIVSFSQSQTASLPDSLDYIRDFIYKGYTLNINRIPVFQYQYKNVSMTDVIQPIPNQQGISHSVSISGLTPSQVLYVRLAKGKIIEKTGEGIYAIDNQRYFIQLTPKVKPEIRNSSEAMELVIPVTTSSTIEFSLIW